MAPNQNRRKVCRAAGAALVLIPIVVISQPACAKTNAKLRAELHYQDTPKGDMKCLTCLEYVPGKKDGFGACKVIPDDDEIAAEGYCVSWNTM